MPKSKCSVNSDVITFFRCFCLTINGIIPLLNLHTCKQSEANKYCKYVTTKKYKIQYFYSLMQRVHIIS